MDSIPTLRCRCIEAKHSVEFRHLIRNASRIRWKVEMECLHIMCIDAYPATSVKGCGFYGKYIDKYHMLYYVEVYFYLLLYAMLDSESSNIFISIIIMSSLSAIGT